MKRILVTGANGYIGRHVVKKLLDMGHDVYACDIRFNEIDSRAKLIEKSIFETNDNIFEELGKPDVCVHLAWREGFIHNSNAHMIDLSKHYAFIKNMIEGGLKHIAVMGSMHEIGYIEGAIDEHTYANPQSLYGISKNTLRQALEILTKNKNVVFQWLRAYYIIGDDANGNSIFAKIIQSEKEGKENFPFTSGKNKYDFISIDELATQISAAISQDQINGIINCCSGEPISLAEKVEEFIRMNDLKIKLNYGEFPDREYDSPAIWGDNIKIQKILNTNY